MLGVWTQELATGLADGSRMKESMTKEYKQPLPGGTGKETFFLEAPEGDLDSPALSTPC